MDVYSQRDHDRGQDHATPLASIVAGSAVSMPSESTLRPSMEAHARQSMASMSFSRQPSPQSYNFSSTEHSDSNDFEKEQFMEPVRTPSRSTTSSAHSGSKFSHLPLVSPAQHHKASRSISKPTETLPEPLPMTTNSMSPHTRKKLLRTARKLSKVLGETPVLSPTLDTPHELSDITDESEFGVFSSSDLYTKTKDTDSKRHFASFANAGINLTLKRGSGLVKSQTVPSRNATLAPSSLTARSSPQGMSREPPVLKVDCSFAVPSGKRTRHSLSSIGSNADALSVISTTASVTSTITSPRLDLYSPSASRQIFRTSEGTISVQHTKEKIREQEARRTKMAKLARYLGERVPAELVFPLNASSSLIDFSAEVDPAADIEAEHNFVMPPPRVSSLVRRRRRRSLQLDQRPESTTSTVILTPIQPASASNTPMNTPSKKRNSQTLLRSQSVRMRAHKGTSLCARSRSGRLRIADPASAPVHINVFRHAPVQAEPDPMSSSGLAALEALKEPSSPFRIRQKSLRMRRVMKMSRVFGSAPSVILPIQTFNAVKHHSIHSVISTAPSQVSTSRLITSGTVSCPISASPETENLPSSLNTTRTSNCSEELDKYSQVGLESTPHERKRFSISEFPATPPPFARYFHPPTPLSVSDSLSPPSSSITPHTSLSHRSQSPLSSSAPDSPPADPTAKFRERRLRAAKLSRFFRRGVVSRYSRSLDLRGPRASGIARMTKSFDRTRNDENAAVNVNDFRSQRSSGETFRTQTPSTRSGSSGSLEGVSVTVQREVDSCLGTAARARGDVEADATRYSSRDYGTGHRMNQSMNSSLNARRIFGTRLATNLERSNSARENAVDSSFRMYATERRPATADESRKENKDRNWDRKELSFVRVGEKPADRSEVISRLRELH